jgi:hypothetical protein
VGIAHGVCMCVCQGEVWSGEDRKETDHEYSEMFSWHLPGAVMVGCEDGMRGLLSLSK